MYSRVRITLRACVQRVQSHSHDHTRARARTYTHTRGGFVSISLVHFFFFADLSFFFIPPPCSSSTIAAFCSAVNELVNRVTSLGVMSVLIFVGADTFFLFTRPPFPVPFAALSSFSSLLGAPPPVVVVVVAVASFVDFVPLHDARTRQVNSSASVASGPVFSFLFFRRTDFKSAVHTHIHTPTATKHTHIYIRTCTSLSLSCSLFTSTYTRTPHVSFFSTKAHVCFPYFF